MQGFAVKTADFRDFQKSLKLTVFDSLFHPIFGVIFRVFQVGHFVYFATCSDLVIRQNRHFRDPPSQNRPQNRPKNGRFFGGFRNLVSKFVNFLTKIFINFCAKKFSVFCRNFPENPDFAMSSESAYFWRRSILAVSWVGRGRFEPGKARFEMAVLTLLK